MKTVKMSITKIFTKLFIIFCMIFLVILVAASIGFYSLQTRSSEEYLDSSLNIMSKNLDEYFYTLEKIGYSISSNWSVINLYSETGYMNKNISIENSYQMMTTLCSIESSVTDIMITDTAGVTRSYFAGIDYNIVNDIPAKNLFYDKFNLDRGFFFFPEDSPWHENYFVYCMPILNLDNHSKTPQKVATGTLLCNKSRILSLLKENTALPYEFYGLCKGEQLIFANTENFEDTSQDNSQIKQSVKLATKDLDLRGINIPQYTYGNSGLILLFGILSFSSICGAMLMFIHYAKKCITSPIQNTKNQLVNFNSSDLSKRIDTTNINEIDDIIVDINHMIDEIKMSTKQIIFTQNSLYETELRKKEAELYALQSQINPHFLYNTLQCICGLATLKRTDDIREVTLAMSDLFRYSVHPGTFVSCTDEINIIYKYLSIYKIRYDGKLKYEISMDEDILDCKMLKMIIQPTVENAMLHAYINSDREPIIRIYGRIENRNIIFNIIDNGTGIEREALTQIQETLNRSFSESIQTASPFGLGLYNINRRIKLVYGEDYGISLFSNPNGTQVDIMIPMQE